VRVEFSKLDFPIVVNTDGAKKGYGGPGPASSGFVVYKDGKRSFSFATNIGIQTNNYAEYKALILALDWILKEIPEGELHVHFKTDSELMARQLTGVYQAKHPDIIPLVAAVKQRLARLDAWKIEHVRREFNKEADEVCNIAILTHADYVSDERA
jgi:ribonuclease HI